jgi:predicted O-linked N-acetylglucosamine transferase (SPINDLY family)
MKWFKHFSDSHDDPFIQELIDRFGSQGYHAYFGLIEIISKEDGYDLTGRLSIKPIYLKRKLRISVEKLQKIYSFCSTYAEQKEGNNQTKPKLMFNSSQEYWHFDFPKILEIKDNYAKDLQVSNKKVSIEEEEEEKRKRRRKKGKEKDEEDIKLAEIHRRLKKKHQAKTWWLNSTKSIHDIL